VPRCANARVSWPTPDAAPTSQQQTRQRPQGENARRGGGSVDDAHLAKRIAHGRRLRKVAEKELQVVFDNPTDGHAQRYAKARSRRRFASNVDLDEAVWLLIELTPTRAAKDGECSDRIT
jgi:hypothetical protein